MSKRIFGQIEGYPEGSTFADRDETSEAGVHGPTVAGISGSQNEGADSIVLSGGYVDDIDNGNPIVYTDHGGQKNGKMVANQTFDRGNKALAISMQRGYPVRVIRGHQLDSPFAPAKGYRYDGLYRVEDNWREEGQ